MGIFGSKNALQRERVYNQGFAFTSFLVDKFGEQVLLDISNALGTPGTFSVTKALEKATGTPGQKLFNQFVDATTLEYQKAVRNLNSISTKTVEEAGFFNFYPRISTSGKNLAYLSNKKHRGATTQLFIRSLADSSSNMHALRVGRPRISGIHPATHRSSDPIIKRIQSAFSFAPSGELVAFSRKTLNGYGERYDDLFIYDLQTEETERLTRSKRLSSPAWNPRRTGIAAIQQSGGTTNLVQVDPATSVITPITNYSKGEQVYTPAWHPNGRTLFFSMSDAFTRNIYRINPRNGQPEAVLTDTLTDYRDPFVGGDGKHLYFSANPDGIFNIYRIPLGAVNPQPQQLTSVIGGAFMPHLRDGTLYFSEFKVDGYKISSISLSDVHAEQMAKTASYQQEALRAFKIPDRDDISQRPSLQDINPLETEKLQALSPDDSLKISFPGTPNIDSHISNHENTYTSFSFYPVIRFDNYTRKNGGNGRLLTAGKFGQLGENLLRDMKLGTYFSSREVTDQLNIFGGAMVGIASEPSDGIGDFFSPGRLTDLDRDLFLTVEHEGLPFIEKRWSPTISLELYNLRRNVDNGLSVEEFPCTSCLPDTTRSDIAYTIWEANLFLRSKINAHTMVEFGAGYSPYRVQTDGFFSQELQQFIPSSSSEYFRGTTLTAAYAYENFVPYPNSDVAPVGLSARIRYTYEPNKLLEEYEIEDGTLSPVYASVKNHSLESTLRWGYPFGENSALNVYGRGFSYVNSPDDFFYLDYIGGFTGMRSYPYFAIGGNTTAMAKLSYTFPVLQSTNQQVGRHTLDKLYLRMFAEAGNGWEGPLDIGQNLKTGAGAELRFAFNSYYLFPLKLFVSGSYGFNKFDVTLPQEFITNGGGSVQYGGDLLFHFGLTFDFDVLSND
jgi:Tol biopolymer transport system component